VVTLNIYYRHYLQSCSNNKAFPEFLINPDIIEDIPANATRGMELSTDDNFRHLSTSGAIQISRKRTQSNFGIVSNPWTLSRVFLMLRLVQNLPARKGRSTIYLFQSQSPSRAQWRTGRRLSPFLSPRPRVCGCSEGYSGGLVHWYETTLLLGTWGHFLQNKPVSGDILMCISKKSPLPQDRATVLLFTLPNEMNSYKHSPRCLMI